MSITIDTIEALIYGYDKKFDVPKARRLEVFPNKRMCLDAQL